MSRYFTVHVDVDSPVILADFYQKNLPDYQLEQLEEFYESTFTRAMSIFKAYNVKATFFCVASEIDKSPKIQALLRRVEEEGHYIGHHTLNHPFGLNELDQTTIEKELGEANDIFKRVIGKIPMGFRSPGYATDTNVVNTLEKMGLRYDSSAGWPLFHVIFKFLRSRNKGKSTMKVGFGETNSGFRTKAYEPSIDNWKKTSASRRKFTEYPLPASFWLIPCYGNLHLYFSPFLVKLLLWFTKRHRHLIYLMHSIEFASIEDTFIPEQITVHPHVKVSNEVKQNKIRQTLKILTGSRKQYIIEEELVKA
jgi:hypothetical protein